MPRFISSVCKGLQRNAVYICIYLFFYVFVSPRTPSPYLFLGVPRFSRIPHFPHIPYPHCDLSAAYKRGILETRHLRMKKGPVGPWMALGAKLTQRLYRK